MQRFTDDSRLLRVGGLDHFRGTNQDFQEASKARELSARLVQ